MKLLRNNTLHRIGVHARLPVTFGVMRVKADLSGIYQ